MSTRRPPDNRERLVEFYEMYNPEKVRFVDAILFGYRENPELLFEKLRGKYGPEPYTLDRYRAPSLSTGAKFRSESTAERLDERLGMTPPTSPPTGESEEWLRTPAGDKTDASRGNSAAGLDRSAVASRRGLIYSSTDALSTLLPSRRTGGADSSVAMLNYAMVHHSPFAQELRHQRPPPHRRFCGDPAATFAGRSPVGLYRPGIASQSSTPKKLSVRPVPQTPESVLETPPVPTSPALQAIAADRTTRAKAMDPSEAAAAQAGNAAVQRSDSTPDTVAFPASSSSVTPSAKRQRFSGWAPWTASRRRHFDPTRSGIAANAFDEVADSVTLPLDDVCTKPPMMRDDAIREAADTFDGSTRSRSGVSTQPGTTEGGALGCISSRLAGPGSLMAIATHLPCRGGRGHHVPSDSSNPPYADQCDEFIGDFTQSVEQDASPRVTVRSLVEEATDADEASEDGEDSLEYSRSGRCAVCRPRPGCPTPVSWSQRERRTFLLLRHASLRPYPFFHYRLFLLLHAALHAKQSWSRNNERAASMGDSGASPDRTVHFVASRIKRGPREPGEEDELDEPAGSGDQPAAQSSRGSAETVKPEKKAMSVLLDQLIVKAANKSHATPSPPRVKQIRGDDYEVTLTGLDKGGVPQGELATASSTESNMDDADGAAFPFELFETSLETRVLWVAMPSSEGAFSSQFVAPATSELHGLAVWCRTIGLSTWLVDTVTFADVVAVVGQAYRRCWWHIRALLVGDAASREVSARGSLSDYSPCLSAESAAANADVRIRETVIFVDVVHELCRIARIQTASTLEAHYSKWMQTHYPSHFIGSRPDGPHSLPARNRCEDGNTTYLRVPLNDADSDITEADALSTSSTPRLSPQEGGGAMRTVPGLSPAQLDFRLVPSHIVPASVVRSQRVDLPSMVQATEHDEFCDDSLPPLVEVGQRDVVCGSPPPLPICHLFEALEMLSFPFSHDREHSLVVVELEALLYWISVSALVEVEALERSIQIVHAEETERWELLAEVRLANDREAVIADETTAREQLQAAESMEWLTRVNHFQTLTVGELVHRYQKQNPRSGGVLLERPGLPLRVRSTAGGVIPMTASGRPHPSRNLLNTDGGARGECMNDNPLQPHARDVPSPGDVAFRPIKRELEAPGHVSQVMAGVGSRGQGNNAVPSLNARSIPKAPGVQYGRDGASGPVIGTDGSPIIFSPLPSATSVVSLSDCGLYTAGALDDQFSRGQQPRERSELCEHLPAGVLPSLLSPLSHSTRTRSSTSSPSPVDHGEACRMDASPPPRRTSGVAVAGPPQDYDHPDAVAESRPGRQRVCVPKGYHLAIVPRHSSASATSQRHSSLNDIPAGSLFREHDSGRERERKRFTVHLTPPAALPAAPPLSTGKGHAGFARGKTDLLSGQLRRTTSAAGVGRMQQFGVGSKPPEPVAPRTASASAAAGPDVRRGSLGKEAMSRLTSIFAEEEAKLARRRALRRIALTSPDGRGGNRLQLPPGGDSRRPIGTSTG